MTGLPEYRNGGLFVDFGVLALKSEHVQRGLQIAREQNAPVQDIPMFEPNDQVIIEWYVSHGAADIFIRYFEWMNRNTGAR
jgi:hypothetical protein